MKPPGPYLIPVLVLFILMLPAAGAAPTAEMVSAAADTTGAPPRDVSSYVSEVKAAETEQNWTSAILITTRGLAWYPDDPELLCLQGYSFRKTGQFQKAVDVVSRSIFRDPRAVRYANRGYGYLALGNNAAALADAETGIARDVNLSTNYGIKALALDAMGRNTDALDAVDRAIALAPGSPHYWHIKGRVLATGGDCAGAAAAFEKSVAIDPFYTLPYPAFGSASENLASLNTTCTPVSSLPAPTFSSMSWVAVVGCMGAVIAFGMKR